MGCFFLYIFNILLIHTHDYIYIHFRVIHKSIQLQKMKTVKYLRCFYLLIIIMNLAWNWLGNNWKTTVIFFAVCRYVHVASFCESGGGGRLNRNIVQHPNPCVCRGEGCEIPALLNSLCFIHVHASQKGGQSIFYRSM